MLKELCLVAATVCALTDHWMFGALFVALFLGVAVSEIETKK